MKNNRLTKLLIIILFLIVLIVLINYGNNTIDQTKYDIYTSNNEDKEILKIVQVSDLHNKEFGKDNDILINKIKDMQPDVIAITGDYIDKYRTNTDISLKLSEELVKIAPVYYINGNHEKFINEDKYFEFENQLREVGVNILLNNTVNYNDKIELIGLDDGYLTSKDGTLKFIVDNIDNSKIKILLAHEPQELEWYAECGIDLVLSGHAHGGQIRIPFTDVGLIAPDQGFFPKYTSGMYEIENTKMIVSRGLGNSIFPIRLFNKPELVEIIIHY